jgi:hypothetical protein
MSVSQTSASMSRSGATCISSFWRSLGIVIRDGDQSCRFRAKGARVKQATGVPLISLATTAHPPPPPPLINAATSTSSHLGGATRPP